MSAIAGIVSAWGERDGGVEAAALSAMVRAMACPARGEAVTMQADGAAFVFLPGPDHPPGAPGLVRRGVDLVAADAWLAEDAAGRSPVADPLEALLDGLKTHGPDEGLRRSPGCWALARWDAARGELLLARDHRGHRPLFWVRGPWGLAFATEIPALLALPGFERRPRPAAVAEFLAVYLFAGDRCLWEGLHRVPSATALSLRPDGETTRRYWIPEALPRRTLDEAAFFAEGRELLARVVSQHLPPSGPVTVALSGGLDSSLVAALAAKGRGPLVALSNRLPDESPESGRDEGPFIDAVAAHLGIETRAIDCGSGDPLAGLDELLAAFGEPTRGALYPDLIVARARMSRELGAGVLLTGDGGDEALSYRHPGRILRLLAAGRGRLFLRALSHEARRRGCGAARCLLSLLAAAPRRALARRRPTGAPLAPLFAEGLLAPGLAEGVLRDETTAAAVLVHVAALGGGVDRGDLLDAGMPFLPGNEQYYEGPALLTERFAVCLRSPLADPRVVDWVRTLPAEFFFLPDTGQDRGVLRRLAAGLLPEVLWRRPDKRVFSPACAARLARRDLSPWLALARADGPLRRWIDGEALTRLGADLARAAEGSAFPLAVLDLQATVQLIVCLSGAFLDPSSSS